MAVTRRTTGIANPARRPKLSDKQIRHFGSKRQKAALERRNAAKRAKVHKSRNRPAKRNPIPETVSLTLGTFNPARKEHKVAKTRSNRRRAHTPVVHHPKRRRQHLVARIHRPRRHRAPAIHSLRPSPNPAHHRNPAHRRNPIGEGWSETFTQGLYTLGGLLGSKYLAQMVLGTTNTGVMGYAGNLAAGGALAFVVNNFLHNKKAAQAVFVGSVIEVIIRALNDYTPYGSYVSGLGMGDYLASNWVTPQRYVDGLNSAQIQIPSGWAPQTVVVSSNAAPTGSAPSLTDSGGIGG